MQLEDGSRVAVIGGGPAGSLFAYFLLKIAEKVDLRLEVDIYEPRHFDSYGPAGCNHCGGIVSESLVQVLAMEGIELPPAVIQRGIDAYMLHTDEESVRIATPSHEKRIAAVYRGGGPKSLTSADWRSFDGYLLALAAQKGARIRHDVVTDVRFRDGRPVLTTAVGAESTSDLAVVACGVSSRLLECFEGLGIGFKRPQTTTAFISEFHLGEDLIQRQLQSAMHVFLLDLPRLKFAALIPKRDFVTVCLLGKDIDDELVSSFLNSPAVRRCLPQGAGASRKASCHCFPRLSLGGASRPFADRLLFVGDSGISRLYKDGIGAAYRTGKAAAEAAILGGVAAKDFQRHFLPACRQIAADNAIGRLVFWVNGLMQGIPFTQRAVVRMTAIEQQSVRSPRDMSRALWDVFTGNAPYREILLRCLRPGFVVRLAWNVIAALLPLAANDSRKPVPVEK